MELYERLLYLIEKLVKNSQNEFSKRIGISAQTLSKYINPKFQDRVRVDLLDRIIEVFPAVNRSWLYYDEGEAFVADQPENPDVISLREDVARLETELAQARKMLVDTQAKYIELLERSNDAEQKFQDKLQQAARDVKAHMDAPGALSHGTKRGVSERSLN